MLVVSNELNCFIKQAGLFVLTIQHLLEMIPGMTMATEKNMVPGDRQSMKVGFVPMDGTCRSMAIDNEEDRLCADGVDGNEAWIVAGETIRSFESKPSSRLCAEGLKGGIGCVPMETK